MNADKLRSLVLVWMAMLILSVSMFGQTPSTIVTEKPHLILSASGIESLRLESKLMGRSMPYRVILPNGYAEVKGSSQRYAVIYLLHGLTGHYTNWTDKTKLAEYTADHTFIIVTPEGDNGWYTDSGSTPNDKYESYVMQELIPEIDAKFRTLADREHRVIAGLSMGGYGSIKFGLKYADKFSLVGSFSGALGAASFNGKNAGAIGKGIDAIYGTDDSEIRKANDIFGLLKTMTPEQIKTLPFIYQSCGTGDFLADNNRSFHTLMVEKKVLYEFRERPGIHDWIFWDDQVREFLDVAERRLKK